MPPPLSIQDKLEKKQRGTIADIIKKIKIQYSFGKVKTWNDIYRLTGYADSYITEKYIGNKDTHVTINEIKEWDKKLNDDLTTSLNKAASQAANELQVVEKVLASAIKPTSTNPYCNTDAFAKSEVEKMRQELKGKDVPATTQSPIVDSLYQLEKSPLEKAFLYYFQRNAAAEAIQKLVIEKKPAILIIGGTGVGKTFVIGAITRRLMDRKWDDGKSFGVTPYIYVTKASIVEKTKRDLRHFSINHPENLEVINIEMLRSRAGKNWIKDETTIIGGEEVRIFTWHKLLNPVVVLWDECQGLKNDSIQRNIALTFNQIDTPTTQIFLSATPFGKISEAKAFCLATKMRLDTATIDGKSLGFPEGSILNEATWPTFAAKVADPADPDDYVEAAMERLADVMRDYIVRIKNVRWQFNPINRVEVIDFSNEEEREEYKRAWERYQIKKAKLDQEITDNPRFRALVELGQFLMAAEYCKRCIFAKRMYDTVFRDGKAAYLAVKFKRTLIAVVKILVEEYGVSRDQISLIWGGGQTQLTDKQKMKQKVQENMAIFEAAGITLEDMALQDVEDRTIEELPKELRLGMQSMKERQKEIDRFQSGKSLFCIYTYKAGGVGLSLHHSDEWVKEKVRHKPESGYAVEEDIPNIPVRPRKGIIGPTWSPIDLAQGSGRGARLTSLSDTEQDFLYYKGTVEEAQSRVVMHKLKCVGKVVRQRENWTRLIEEYERADLIADELIARTAKDEKDDKTHDDDSETVNEGSEE